jgi:peptidoglycan hydrolase CwlO-like protein
MATVEICQQDVEQIDSVLAELETKQYDLQCEFNRESAKLAELEANIRSIELSRDAVRSH